MERPSTDDRNKRKRSETGENNDAMHFVYTSETKDGDIPKATLTHLKVDSSVSEIPANAFKDYKALVQVQLPETLTRIGESAFQACSNLKFVQFVSRNTSLVEAYSSINDNSEADGTIVFPERAKLQIDDGAFHSCHSIRKVIVSSSPTTLGKSTFENCKGLVSVELPVGLQVIESSLCRHCISLTAVKIPASVTKIDTTAFSKCNMTSVDLPDGLLEVGRFCFYGCNAIERVDIPSTVIKIGKGAFQFCKGLRYVTLPATLEIIEYALFSGCLHLEYIEIPTTVKTIANMAFYGCASLSHLRIPPNVDSIGRKAFADCRSLISIELPEDLTLHFTEDEDYGVSEFSSLTKMVVSENSSLVNVAFPGLTGNLNTWQDYLQGVKFGKVVDDYDDLCHKLKHRFDNNSSPLTKLCYYQSYHSEEDAMTKLNSLMDNDPLAATNERDVFGMTPLHVLSLSQTPNLSMMIAVINAGRPDHIIRVKDSFGAAPMDYLCLNRIPNSTELIDSLLQATVVKRLEDSPGLAEWKSDIIYFFDEALAQDWSIRRRIAIGFAYYMIAKYERKEILALLEMVLWKSKMMIDFNKNDDKEQGAATATAAAADRQSCRINSGASIVIPHVLPFLEPINKDDYLDSGA